MSKLPRDTRQDASAGMALQDDACWIWAAGATGANSYAEFRCGFEVAGDPDRAWLQLSAETSLRLWVNGQWVHAGPPREVPPYFYFDTIDLRPWLRAGHNELRIVAHHQGQNSASYQAGTPAILVGGSCMRGRRRVVNFAEVGRWRARRVARYLPDAQRLFSCIGYAEHVDFKAAERRWGKAVEVARHPWTERPKALARDLPMFSETVREPVSSAAHDGGWLVDFGREVSGFVELEVQSKRRITLRVAYAEALVDGRVRPEKGGMAYYDVLELPRGRTCWRSYEKRAFRYVHLSEAVEVRGMRVIEQGYPYVSQYAQSAGYRRNERTDEGRLINRILETSARTIALNTEDLLTDCPWRERAQYMDCFFYMGAMHKLFGTLAPVRRFLNQFPRGADETGLLRSCYPSPKGTVIIPDFSMTYAVQLREYLKLSGDLATIRRNLALAERGVTAFGEREDEAGLLVDVPGWIFLDNTFELPKFPRSAGLNAVYYGGQRALAELLRACGRAKRAAELEAQAARLRAAFRRAFVRGERVLDCDATPAYEHFRHWVYHYSAESGKWEGKSFRLRIDFRLKQAGQRLRLAAHDGARAWIDGRPVADIAHGGSWAKSALYQAVELETPADTGWHRLDLEIQWSGIDWECYLSCAGDVEWSQALVWEETEFGKCDAAATPGRAAFTSALRRHELPWMTQATVGYAAYHGLLERAEARRFLRACLPDSYRFSFAKRTTPFFAVIADSGAGKRILPCNVPASMFYFCHALRNYGMAAEARKLLLRIYGGMLERGATTWWEEWNTRSSLCHAWASFVAEFMD